MVDVDVDLFARERGPEQRGLAERVHVPREGQTGTWHIEGEQVSLAHPPHLDSIAYVRGKVHGKRFTRQDLSEIVRDIVAGRYSDMHLAAFITAIALAFVSGLVQTLVPNLLKQTTDALVTHGAPADLREAAQIPIVRNQVEELLGKALIRLGFISEEQLLMTLAEQLAEIEHFIIAGSFGAYLSIDSAMAIGLLPRLPRARFAQVGNAAGLGVRQMLASHTARERARQIAARCQYQELASRADKASVSSISSNSSAKSRSSGWFGSRPMPRSSSCSKAAPPISRPSRSRTRPM